MEIKQTALAGTLESSDVQITLSKGQGINIDLNSSVEELYGKQIKKVITDTLAKYEITDANVKVVDKGALDCVIKARMMAVIQRALGTADQPNWEVL
ncbi:citrate lyase acyl carrier protein [Limosilactobacillus gorillae]|uniref:citrate lyase acyl carrier protein n=1 Tax=Limosilactobacillus gorillae TaxID=1450649 RepID=UPI000ABB0276|nr:citrate lyase acyl carrier protein [Limosilactobacillus gorillae]